MEIIIKYFYIFSILIVLNSSMLIHINVDITKLKSELTKFKDKDGYFLVKMGKWSDDENEWEYKSEITSNDYAPLIVPEDWENLFNNRKENESFVLAINVEMVDKKLFKPIPFILHKNKQSMTLHLEEREKGSIYGRISLFGQKKEEIKADKMEIKSFMKKIENKLKPTENVQMPGKEAMIEIGAHHGILESHPNVLPQNVQNPAEHEKIQQISEEKLDNSRRKEKGKMVISGIGNKEKRSGKRAQHSAEPKLMESSFDAYGQAIQAEIGSNEHQKHPQKLQKLGLEKYLPIPSDWLEHRNHENLYQFGKLPTATGEKTKPIFEHRGEKNELAKNFSSGFKKSAPSHKQFWKGVKEQQHLGQRGEKHLKGIEIGGDELWIGSNPQIRQLVINESDKEYQRLLEHFNQIDQKHGKKVIISDDNHNHLQNMQKLAVDSPIPPHLQGHQEDGNLAKVTGGYFLNELIENFADEYGERPSELAPGGFIHQNQDSANIAVKNKGGKIEGGQQNSQIHLIDEKSMASERLREFFPTGSSHQGQSNKPMNIIESRGHKNLHPIQTAKTSSSSFNAVGQQHNGNGNVSDPVAVPSTGSDYTAIGDDDDGNEIANMFKMDDQENPSL